MSHSFWARFFAGWWGTFVFHFAMIVVGSIHNWDSLSSLSDSPFSEAVIFPAFFFLCVYGALFAFVVAFGVPKGSLIRHFLLGVILPLVAYTMAGTLLKRLIDPGTFGPLFKIGGITR